MSESPQEREERLSHQEERLTHAHERRKEALSLDQQQPSTGGGIRQFISEHRTGVIIGVIVTVVVAWALYQSSKGQSAASNASQLANQQGSLGNAGYQDQGTAYALTQLSQQLNNLQANMNIPPPKTTPPPTTNPTKVRAQFALGGRNNVFDKRHQGVNLFSSVNGKVSGFLPWGSDVTIVSGPIAGNASSPFYKLSNGMYVLGQDLVNIPTTVPAGTHGSGTGFGEFPFTASVVHSMPNMTMSSRAKPSITQSHGIATGNIGALNISAFLQPGPGGQFSHNTQNGIMLPLSIIPGPFKNWSRNGSVPTVPMGLYPQPLLPPPVGIKPFEDNVPDITNGLAFRTGRAFNPPPPGGWYRRPM